MAIDERLGLFDPALYREVRQPLGKGKALPPWCYTSEEFFKRERDRIFAKMWNYVGRAEHIPRPGAYFTMTFNDIPLVVVRTQQGSIATFVNSCRHRGTQLVEGHGNCKAIRCPYHSWTYSLEGELLVAPGMDREAAFDPGNYRLKSIRTEVWEGFIFINLDPSAPSLLQYLGALNDRLAPYRMGAMQCVRRSEYELNCNWKVVVENFKDSYHIATVHRKSIQRYASVKSAGYEVIESRGEYLLSFARHAGSMALLKGDIGFPKIASLGDDLAEGSHFVLIYPATAMVCTIDCIWYLTVAPRDPRSCTVVAGFCFPGETIERGDFKKTVRRYYRRWDVTLDEDNAICEMQQKGLNSAITAGGGLLSEREANVLEIGNWILDRVLDS